jgi:AAA family ATP:ADP antiporter
MAKTEMTPGDGGRPAAGDDGLLVKMLSVFAVVHGSEVFSVLLLTLDGVLLLASYYFLKVIREPLILAAPGGAETKSYATAFLAVLLIGVFYGYRALAQRVNRLRLITYTKIFCAACLVVFCILGHMGVKIGIPFFLWVGCYSLTILAQFWAFANDIYTPEQGKRVFAIIGVGSSLGALIGSQLAGMAVKPLGLYNMMLVPAGVLMVCLVLVRVVNAHETTDAARKKESEVPPGGKGGISMIFSHRYLLLIAAIIFLLNLVNTNGEYILDRTLEMVKDERHLDQAEAKIWLGQFKATYFFWANLAGVVLQLFVASRVFKYLDVRGALFIYPLLVICTYTGMTMAPVALLLTVVEGGKIAENSLDYSIYNQAKQSLWLPTSREQKYVAKQAIDTFVVRAGDLMSAGVVFVGTSLALGTRAFTMTNVVLGVVFLFIVILMGREHKKRAAEVQAKDDAEGKGAPESKSEKKDDAVPAAT